MTEDVMETIGVQSATNPLQIPGLKSVKRNPVIILFNRMLSDSWR